MHTTSRSADGLVAVKKCPLSGDNRRVLHNDATLQHRPGGQVHERGDQEEKTQIWFNLDDCQRQLAHRANTVEVITKVYVRKGTSVGSDQSPSGIIFGVPPLPITVLTRADDTHRQSPSTANLALQDTLRLPVCQSAPPPRPNGPHRSTYI